MKCFFFSTIQAVIETIGVLGGSGYEGNIANALIGIVIWYLFGLGVFRIVTFTYDNVIILRSRMKQKRKKEK